MKIPYLKNSWKRAHSTLSTLITIGTALLCLQPHGQAQQTPDSQSDLAVNPLKFVYWTSGPQKVTLGDVARINLPAGYRLTDLHGARTILAAFNNPIPDDLVGILAPVSGRWMAILEYAPSGYVKDPAFKQGNMKATLKQVLQHSLEQGQSSIASLSWQSQPAYDARARVLQWSIQIVTPSAKISDQAAAIFGRQGVFQITVSDSASHTGAFPLKQLINNVSFKDGERYADYKNGDKIAQIGMADLISGKTHAQTTGFFSGEFETVVPWIYGGLAFCLIGGMVVLGGNRRQCRQARTIRKEPLLKIATPSPPSTAAKIEPNKNGQPLDQPKQKPAPNVGRGAALFRCINRDQGERMFDYQRFYADMLRDLSRRSSVQPRMGPGKPIFINHAKLNRAKTKNRKPQII